MTGSHRPPVPVDSGNLSTPTDTTRTRRSVVVQSATFSRPSPLLPDSRLHLELVLVGQGLDERTDAVVLRLRDPRAPSNIVTADLIVAEVLADALVQQGKRVDPPGVMAKNLSGLAFTATVDGSRLLRAEFGDQAP